MTIRKILVPTDLSPASDAAQRFAAALAKENGAELLLYHAVPTHAEDSRHLGELLSDFLSRLETDGRAELDREAAQLRSEGLTVGVEVEQKDSAFGAIQRKIESFEPDLVVMGTHGREGTARWFLGSVAEKIVRHAPCWVATVREDVEPRVVRRILVPIDFSDNARRAVGAAITLAGDRARIVVHHVVLNPAFAGLHPGENLRLFEADPGLPVRLKERMKTWMEDQPFEAEVTEAEDASESIVAQAGDKRAELIVMGSRGLTGVDYFLMGSVAEKVVRSATVPVLVVK